MCCWRRRTRSWVSLSVGSLYAEHHRALILGLVIERNWGERHGLSGAWFGLPREYTWIYAPRDEEELAVVEKLMVAGTGFMTNAKAVNH